MIDTTTLPHLAHRHLSDSQIRSLGLMAKHADPVILRNWATDLRLNADKQTTGTYYEPETGCWCAVGRLLAMTHPDLNLAKTSYGADNRELADVMGIPSEVDFGFDKKISFWWAVVSLNDATGRDNLGLTFPQIADILEAVADAQV